MIKILFHYFSHSVPLSLSLSVTPSEALILSQNSLKLSSSLSHSLKLPHSLPPARPNRPKLSIASDPSCQSPLCLIGGGGGCVGRLALVGGWVHRHWWAVVWLNSRWAVVGK